MAQWRSGAVAPWRSESQLGPGAVHSHGPGFICAAGRWPLAASPWPPAVPRWPIPLTVTDTAPPSPADSPGAAPTTAPLTWTVLLAGFARLAKASLALPADQLGDRWRNSIASIIALQSVTFALADLHRLDAAERPLALDKAEMLIAEHERLIRGLWSAAPVLPESLADLIIDARAALSAARALPAIATTTATTSATTSADTPANVSANTSADRGPRAPDHRP